jgi:wyosine [tRNA(Phe)-imidazoG37] synthetase (radical SAM superfamily)
MKYRHLFGPVPSRRLGVSLGIDLVPHKVCNLNCIYCEIGKTTVHTNERKVYVDDSEIIAELNTYLSTRPHLDFITFSGAGEPTLNSAIGQISQYIKEHYPQYKLALITNSMLFRDAYLRKELLNIDLVLPSLDAASDKIFKQINRPANGFQIEDVIEGLALFRKEFRGQIWLEIFIVPGINDNEKELSELKKAVIRIQPDRTQINSIDRPGTEKWIQRPGIDKLKEIAAFFAPIPNVEIIARFDKHLEITSLDDDKEEILISTLKRRPCSFEDLLNVLRVNEHELGKYIRFLKDKNKIDSYTQNGILFYKAKR